MVEGQCRRGKIAVFHAIFSTALMKDLGSTEKGFHGSIRLLEGRDSFREYVTGRMGSDGSIKALEGSYLKKLLRY